MLTQLLVRPTFSLSECKAARLAAVQSYRESRQSESGSTLAPKSFAELTGRVPTTTPGYAAHAAHYRKFLSTVSSLLGGEAPPEEVASAANSAFRALQALPLTDHEAPPGLALSAPSGAGPSRQVLARARTMLTGSGAAFSGTTVAEDAIKQLLASHVPLAAWLKEHRQSGGKSEGQGHGSTSTSSAAGKPVGTEPRGFGADEARGSGSDWRASVGVARIDEYRSLLRDAEAVPDEDHVPAPVDTAPPASAQAASAPAASAPSATNGRAADKPAAAAAGGGGAADASASPAAASTAEVGSVEWVRSLCRTHLEARHAIEGGGGHGESESTVGQTEIDTLAATLLDRLYSGLSDDELQSDLLSMLGFDAIELIGAVFPQRQAVTAAARRLLAAFEAVAEAANGDGGSNAAGSGALGGSQLGTPAGGSVCGPLGGGGCGVTMTSQSAQRMEKQRRKDAAKHAKEKRRAALDEVRSPAELEAELTWLAAGGFEPAGKLLKAKEQAAAPKPTEDATLAALRSAASIGGLAKALPDGTQRRTGKGWEEVTVPPTPKSARAEQRLVSIAELPEHAQLAFKGVERLNQLQSAVAPVALHSNENMLVCAPTGAGKTNVAMLSIMQQVGTCIEGGVLNKEALKMVYIAPMKALAQEVVGKFGKALAPLGLQVREYTGDMQLTKRELSATNLIVTTPEKWDVVTRKGSDALVSQVGLLIIDEVHLLNDDRGPVIEALVARTLRLVESSQQMIRIVGLSATLPNYTDVALFLKVNPASGLFHFGPAYRPVPLTQTFIGVTKQNVQERNTMMLQIAYDKALAAIRRGKQVMVFVHARNDTVRTARALLEMAKKNGDDEEFRPKLDEHPRYQLMQKEVNKSKSAELRELFAGGFGVHHAGMLRPDRSLSERIFSDGLINVLVCTATLAWGVNLPAHTVIIKGTQLYDPEKGAFVDLGVLDVQQIFGRAGRPQFDVSGEGIIITQHAKLAHYLQMLTQSYPIESQFVSRLSDHLNAEVALGTVTSVREAVTWLSYTYLYVRMLRNPLAYGIPFEQMGHDPHLWRWRVELVEVMARRLDAAKMLRFHPQSGSLDVTELGRTASHYYLSVGTVETFDEMISPTGTEADILDALCHAAEFTNIKVREEEMEELETLADQAPLAVRGGLATKEGKTCVLMQTFISGLPVKAFALVSDCTFIAQSAARIARGLFEIALGRGWLSFAEKVLRVSKSLEQRAWNFRHPLRQLHSLPFDVYDKLESKRAGVDTLREMSVRDIGALVNNQRQAHAIKQEAMQLPALEVEVNAQPITRTVLRVSLTLAAAFDWVDRHHGGAEPWWIWVEDTENEHIYHKELWVLPKAHKDEAHTLAFTIPLFEPLPPCYFVRAISNRWLGVETIVPLPLAELVLPSAAPAHTELLDLRPLPKSAVANEEWEGLFKFSHFNPVQTQVFHSVYHTDDNILLGSPTGSGKTVSAELAVLRLLRCHPGMKAVYIAPLKALVRERMDDWGHKFVQKLGYKLEELTGDVAPDARALMNADILATTPEKWDGVSRHWQQRPYVRKVGLVIIDEIHLLGEDRGPILEIIVSRMRYIATKTSQTVRIVGLSTAMANAHDLADWLGIPPDGLYNFKPSVRPVPLEVHISGFPGKHYCPRMAAMNKPTYRAILNHSPDKPVLVFVSSRRQTRLTALDLIAYCSADERESQFVNIDNRELEPLLSTIRDQALRHTLAFGVGIHHAGLAESDRTTVERLFVEQKIMVLVCTSTLAWGVNFPAHLVVVKGTEFFDGKQKRYVDFPVTDVLQMMGRAGRPQFDQQGIAVILVHEPKKTFYRKFLYEPFPVESCLQEQLHDHFNAEVVSGTIKTKQDGVDFLTWTYFFRRLTRNPAYYHLEDNADESVAAFLSDLVEATLADLQNAGCVEVDDELGRVQPQTLGHIASYYYLKYTTVALFCAELHDVDEGPTELPALLRVLCDASEFDELPVRHNEEHVNAQMARELPWPVDERACDSPHVKAVLLLQAHFARAALPMSDYVTDTKSVLDQALRVLQAMVDVAADGGWLFTTLGAMHLSQMVTQGRWHGDEGLTDLPGLDTRAVDVLAKRHSVTSLRQLCVASQDELRNWLKASNLSAKQLSELHGVLRTLPNIGLHVVDPPPLAPGDEAALTVHLKCRNLASRSKAFAPRFPKPKQSGWWLVLGEEDELLALKRIRLDRGATTAQLMFDAPDEPGEYDWTVLLVSDSYIGLDARVDVRITVKPFADLVVK